MSGIAEAFSNPTDLVTLPEVYLKVKRIIDNPNAGLSELAAVVTFDPALSAQFLKIANCPLFRSLADVTTVSRAVAVLGTQHVHDIVLTASIAGMFSRISPKLMDVRRFWTGAVKRGVIAQGCAAAVGVLDNEHVFVEGLLSGIGHLAMCQKLPGAMRAVLAEAEASGGALHVLEQQRLGFDYCEVGAMLASAWALPAPLVTCIRFHQQPGNAPAFQFETALVHIAARLADSPDPARLALDPAAVAITDLTVERARALAAASEAKLAEVLATFRSLPVRAAA